MIQNKMLQMKWQWVPNFLQNFSNLKEEKTILWAQKTPHVCYSVARFHQLPQRFYLLKWVFIWHVIHIISCSYKNIKSNVNLTLANLQLSSRCRLLIKSNTMEFMASWTKKTLLPFCISCKLSSKVETIWHVL